MSQIDKCFKYFTSQPDRGPEPRWSVVEERHQPVHRSDQVSISKTYSWRWWWCYVLATRWPTTTDSQGGVRLDLRKWKDRLKSSTPAGQLWEPQGWPSWKSWPHHLFTIVESDHLDNTKRTGVYIFNKNVLKCPNENVPKNGVKISKRPHRNPKPLTWS